jgi:hypothetical protein
MLRIEPEGQALITGQADLSGSSRAEIAIVGPTGEQMLAAG